MLNNKRDYSNEIKELDIFSKYFQGLIQHGTADAYILDCKQYCLTFAAVQYPDFNSYIILYL